MRDRVFLRVMMRNVWMCATLTAVVCFEGCGGRGSTEKTRADDERSRTGQDGGKTVETSAVENTPERIPSLADRDGPVAVMKKKYFALMDRDKKAFLECFAPSTPADFLEAYYDASAEAFAFKRSVYKAYGNEGVERFESFVGDAGMVAFRLPPLDGNDRWWEKVEVRIMDDDRVLCDDPYEMDRFCMVRKDGVWRIDLSSRKLAHEVERQRTFKRSLEECALDIGKPGVTVDDLRRKLGTYQ